MSTGESSSSQGSPDSATSNECPVCYCEADHSHFGGIRSCNGCAAFFRRTIVYKKSYKCRGNEKCGTKKEKHQRGCQYCRFNKCLKIGMSPDMVLSKPSSSTRIEDEGGMAVGFLMKHRRANFTNRGTATVEVYGGADKFITMSNQLKTADSCRKALTAENRVLTQFIQNLGIADLDERQFLMELSAEFLPMWVASESLFSTVRHRGFRSRRSYYLDDSYLFYNEDYVVNYYRQYGCLFDPFSVARMGFELYTAVLQTSEKLYNSRITEPEMVAIQTIFLLQSAMRINPRNDYFRKMLGDLFLALRTYYNDTYEDVAVRFGTLMLNIERVQDVKRHQDQAFVMQNLNDGNGNSRLQIRPFTDRDRN